MASIIPKFVKKAIVDAWVAEDLRVMLLANTFTPNAGTQQYVGQADVLSHRIPASGPYTIDGVTLAGKSQQYEGNNAYLDANDLSIGPGATLSYRYAVIYAYQGGSLATSPIRAIIEFPAVQSVTNGTSVIQWNALGIIYLT